MTENQEYIDSPLFGRSYTPNQVDMLKLAQLAKHSPVAVFQMFNKFLNTQNLAISIVKLEEKND